MGFVVEYPINVHIDNVVSILLSYNTLLSQRMKHIYVHNNFIWDYAKDRTVKNIFFC